MLAELGLTEEELRPTTRVEVFNAPIGQHRWRWSMAVAVGALFDVAVDMEDEPSATVYFEHPDGANALLEAVALASFLRRQVEAGAHEYRPYRYLRYSGAYWDAPPKSQSQIWDDYTMSAVMGLADRLVEKVAPGSGASQSSEPPVSEPPPAAQEAPEPEGPVGEGDGPDSDAPPEDGPPEGAGGHEESTDLVEVDALPSFSYVEEAWLLGRYGKPDVELDGEKLLAARSRR